MEFQDQLQRRLTLSQTPRRVVSLVPSITELLADFGLEEEVVGITKFCVKPDEWFRSKERIGGTKTANLDKIEALQPDLIIANKEENDQEQIEALAKQFPVWISEVVTIEDALSMIGSLGEVFHRTAHAEVLGKEISTSLQSMAHLPRKRAAYLVWNDPTMLAGADTFIHHMMEALGFDNVVSDSRYPKWSDQEIAEARPDILLLPSEPFPFAEKHLADFKERFPSIPALLVDGEMFSWYGSRMRHTADYARELQRAL